MIDLYCERMDAGFWAEPFNALSNLAFLVAAGLAWREAKACSAMTPGTLLLIALLAMIGLGSFLFHTLATAWAQAADLIPILLFQVVYLWIFTARVMRLHVVYRVTAVVGLLIAVAGFAFFSAIANGSLIYLPAVVVLLLLGLVNNDRAAETRPLLWLATAIFVASIALRSIDLAICEHFAVGTHFVWHLLNASVLFLVIEALIQVTATADRHSKHGRALSK